MNLAVCWCPALVAIWNAFKSSLLRSCASAPAFINISIIRSWPVAAASISAVSPTLSWALISISWALISKLRVSRNSTISGFFDNTASINNVLPSSVRVVRSALWSLNRLTISKCPRLTACASALCPLMSLRLTSIFLEAISCAVVFASP